MFKCHISVALERGRMKRTCWASVICYVFILVCIRTGVQSCYGRSSESRPVDARRSEVLWRVTCRRTLERWSDLWQQSPLNSVVKGLIMNISLGRHTFCTAIL